MESRWDADPGRGAAVRVPDPQSLCEPLGHRNPRAGSVLTRCYDRADLEIAVLGEQPGTVPLACLCLGHVGCWGSVSLASRRSAAPGLSCLQPGSLSAWDVPCHSLHRPHGSASSPRAGISLSLQPGLWGWPGSTPQALFSGGRSRLSPVWIQPCPVTICQPCCPRCPFSSRARGSSLRLVPASLAPSLLTRDPKPDCGPLMNDPVALHCLRLAPNTPSAISRVGAALSCPLATPRGRPLPPSLRRYRPSAQGVPALLGSPQHLLFPPGPAWSNPRASVLRQSCISRQPVTRSTGRSHQRLVRPLSPALHPAPALSVPGQFPFHPRGVSSPWAVPRCPESGSSIAPDSIPQRSPRCRLCLSVPSAWAPPSICSAETTPARL